MAEIISQDKMDDGLAEFERALEVEKRARDQEQEKKSHHQESRRRHRTRDSSSRHHRRRPSRSRSRDRDRRRTDEKRRETDDHRHSRHSDHHSDYKRRRESPSRSKRHRDEDQDRRRERDPEEGKPEDRHLKRRRNSRDSPKKSSHDLDDIETEETLGEKDTLTRDSWMVAPSALDLDYVHRQQASKPESKHEPESELKQEVEPEAEPESTSSTTAEDPSVIKVDYTFGDAGSRWRLMKLDAVYRTAERDQLPVEEVALKQYGSLREFDIAREEKVELDRRRRYGRGYTAQKEKPTGDLYQERLSQPPTSPTQRQSSSTSHRYSAILREAKADRASREDARLPDHEAAAQPKLLLDQSTLNRMRAQMVKAKLQRASNAAQLEEEYNEAVSRFARQDQKPATDVVLGPEHARMLGGARAEVKAVETRRGRERGTVEENTELTLDDMVREERRTQGQASLDENRRLAERIAKDGAFANDLEYLDDNAAKLAKRVHKSDLHLKNMAIDQFQKMNKALDQCPLCHHEDEGRPPVAPVVSLGTRVFLTLATSPELTPGCAMIVPVTHHRNLLACDDDEWEEVRNFMKALTRMYHAQGHDVVFYENAAAPPGRYPHAAMSAVPIPYADGATVPAYFREAMLTSDEEWSQHRKVIDTQARAEREGYGRAAFRRSLAAESPYFHVWFTLDGGLGHIVENTDRWPRGDLFARQILGGLLDTPPHLVHKQGRWNPSVDRPRVEAFRPKWRQFDWTRVLYE